MPVKNKEKSDNQKDRHTMGPNSFARKRYELQQADKKPPSQALMYKETRKRKEGKDYKSPYEPIKKNIDRMEQIQTEKQVGGDEAYYEVIDKPESSTRRLFGMSCAREKQKLSPKSDVLIPDEFLQSYTSQIVKATVHKVINILKDKSPTETLDSINPLLEGPSGTMELENLVIGKSSEGIHNQTFQYSEDTGGDGLDRDNTLERIEEAEENDKV